MAEVLSQSQIDELLNGLSSGDVDIQQIEPQDKKIKEYDFRSPKKITKETVKMLSSVYENYCRQLSSLLTSKLSLLCDVSIEQIEESRYNEYNNALPDYALTGLVDIKYPDDKTSESQILIEMSRSMSYVIIDRLLGGSGSEYDCSKNYTDIELAILSNLFQQLVGNMGHSWESTLEIETVFDKIETNPRFIQSINYNDTVVIIVLNAIISEISGKITLCIPSIILDEIYKKSHAYARNSRRKSDTEDLKEVIMDSIKPSLLEVKGLLGKAEISLNDIVNMQVGDVIELKQNVNEDISIMVDDEVWFKGKWGTRKNKNVLKINEIIND